MAKPNANARPEPKVEEVAAVWCDIKDLKPWDRNPRRNDKAIAKVAASMKRFGWGAPILARTADREIIAGHTRILAAESLGMTRVPVRFLDLDPADAHLLALADNKLNEIAEWDTAAVATILSEYGLEDAALAGWDAAELDKMAAEIADAPTPESSAEEIDVNSFELGCRCPRCGFEFNPKEPLRLEPGRPGQRPERRRQGHVHVRLRRWLQHGLQARRLRGHRGQ
jgi:hypothetical protein